MEKRSGYKTAAVIILTLLSAYGLANLEVIRRARASYMRGEEFFAKRDYKHAMWCYQETQEFYYLPHSHWVDDSEHKEWICRAQLGDFIPPEGPLDADLRKDKPEIYQKYQAEIAQITPSGDISYDPAPETPEDKMLDKKIKKKK
jgi:hypothetical protein